MKWYGKLQQTFADKILNVKCRLKMSSKEWDENKQAQGAYQLRCYVLGLEKGMLHNDEKRWSNQFV